MAPIGAGSPPIVTAPLKTAGKPGRDPGAPSPASGLLMIVTPASSLGKTILKRLSAVIA